MRRGERMTHHIQDRHAARTGRVALELEDEQGNPSWALSEPAQMHFHHVPGLPEKTFVMPMGLLAHKARKWLSMNPSWRHQTQEGRLLLCVPIEEFRRAFPRPAANVLP